MRLKNLPVLCTLILSLLATRQSAQTALQTAIKTFLKDDNLANASVSISILDVSSGKMLASHQPDLSLAPASSLKVVTTATAMSLLGPDYTFKTELQYDGSIDRNGQLHGNLYLKGYGDPTLGSDQMQEAPGLDAVMEKFRLALQQKGIRKINGHVVGDASWFGTDVNCDTWQWNDLGNYYAAGIWGLNIHENLYYLRFRQTSRLGAIPAIGSIETYIEGLAFYNEVTSAGRGTGDNAYIYGAPYDFTRYVRGTIPVGSQLFSIKGSMPDPPLFAAQYLRASLEEVGIPSSDEATTQLELERRGKANDSRTTFYSYHSPDLEKIVRRANMKSVNLYCESLLKTISKARNGDGSLESGTKILLEYWEDRGVNTRGVFLDDGSGLSARNAVTTRFMVQLLRKKTKDKDFEACYNSIPVDGEDGPLRNTLKGTAAEGRLSAKSGTIKRVRSYTGYARTRTGNLRAFSIIVNNYSGSGGAIRKRMETLMLAFVKD